MFLSTTTRLLLSLLRPALLRPRFNSDFAPWELRALKQLEVMEAEARAKSLLPKTTQYCDFPLHRLRNEACSRGLGSKGKKSEIIYRLENDDKWKGIKIPRVTDRPRIIIGKVPLRVRNRHEDTVLTSFRLWYLLTFGNADCLAIPRVQHTVQTFRPQLSPLVTQGFAPPGMLLLSNPSCSLTALLSMLYNNLSCHLRDLGIGQIWSYENVLPDGISPALRGGALAIRPELVLGRGADGEGPDCAGGVITFMCTRKGIDEWLLV